MSARYDLYSDVPSDILRSDIRVMQFTLKRRENPKWTGLNHEWDTPFGHPLQRQCTRCHVPMVPLGTRVDLTDDRAVRELYLREECPL